MIKKFSWALLFAFLILSSAAGSGYSEVRVHGSFVGIPFPSKAIELYEKSGDVKVDQIGKNKALINLAGGSCDIAISTWAIDQLDDAAVLDAMAEARKKGISFEETPMVIDAIVPIVHKDNPVRKLSLEQLHKIYTGKIRKWHDIDPAISVDIPIEVLSTTEGGDGKYIIWADLVINGTSADDVGYGKGPKDMGAFVATDDHRWSIGYDSMHYIKVDTNSSKPYKAKSIDIVTLTNNEKLKMGPSAEYPVSRYLYAVTRSDITKDADEFFDHLYKPSVQNLAYIVGQLPLPQDNDRGSSGCNAAFPAIAVLAFVPVFLFRKK